MTLTDLLPSWRISLRALNRSERTIVSYELAARQLIAWVGDVDVAEIRTEDVRAYLADVLENRASATARQRYASLRQLFKWLDEEGEVAEGSNPMAKVKPPRVIQRPPDVIEMRHVKALLDSCHPRTFVDRRDEAIIRVLWDTGIRLGELVGLKVTDLELEDEVFVVTGKGRREREIHLSRNTVMALDRYLRERRRHESVVRGEDEGWLWLGAKGRLGPSGVHQLLRRRCERLRLPQFSAHQFRHTHAHEHLLAGGQEVDLMNHMGWASAQMLSRYGASAAGVRAIEAHKRLGLGNRL